MRSMIDLGRVPQIMVLENVVGTLTSHNGRDFATIIRALVQEDYRVGALVIDAVRFLPQSRPRLFIVGVRKGCLSKNSFRLIPRNHGTQIFAVAFERSRSASKTVNGSGGTCRFRIEPIPSFASLIEEVPRGVEWHTKEQTDHIIDLMSPLHLEKLRRAQLLREKIVGTVYRRIRPKQDGVKTQRAEIRFDQISGCLRTPVGRLQ